jgi:hypothetical protein
MPSINEARILAKMDQFIKGQIAKAKQFSDEQIKKMSPLDMDPPDRSCEVKSGALPVSAGLMAVNYGCARLALRVLPRLGQKMISDQVLKMLGNGMGTIFKILAAKRIPVVGDIMSIGTGVALDIDVNDFLQKTITELLGCKPNEFDAMPMRKAINVKMGSVKVRGKNEPRRVKKVHTRRP